MARGSRHARKLARTFQLRDWSVGLSGARQCVAQNGVTRAAGSGSRRGQCHGLLTVGRSEEHTSELQSRLHLVCRLLLEKKKKKREASRHTECEVIYSR